MEGEDLVDDDRFSPARFERERAVGASDRDLARRIHGSLQNRQCEDVLNCMDNTCMMREASKSWLYGYNSGHSFFPFT